MKNNKSVIKEIKKGHKAEGKELNIIPISNWMITTAYIEVQTNSLFVGNSYAPTFINMQQVLAIGPNVVGVAKGDWVYIDMDRFVKTIKKKSTIVAGVGGRDMITEQLVPPIFVSPGSDVTYFKISDREIEGIIPNPHLIKQKYQTIEDYVEWEKKMKKENIINEAKFNDNIASELIKKSYLNPPSIPMIITETSKTKI